jgi:hypothetical protein
MPNWCYNQTVFYGDTKKLKEVFDKVEQKVYSKTGKFESISLDPLLIELGCPQEMLNKEFWIRGHIVDIDLLDKGEIILSYETAWNPVYEKIETILEMYCPQIKSVTICEECGCEIYINTDKERKYFKDEYYLDIVTGTDSIYGEHYNGMHYHQTIETVVAELKDIFEVKQELTTFEEVENFLNSLDDEDVYITFEKFTLD